MITASKDGDVIGTDTRNRRGKQWTIKVAEGVTLKAGDVITLTQSFKGNTKTQTVTVKLGDSEAHGDITVPKYKLWAEDSFTSIDRYDLQEFLELIKEKNPTIEGHLSTNPDDIISAKHDGASDKSTFTLKFKDGTTRDYRDDSFTIQQATDRSVAPQIQEVSVVDETVTVTFATPIDGATRITLKIGTGDIGCTIGKCKQDKQSYYESVKDWKTVGNKGEQYNTYTYDLSPSEQSTLKYDSKIGVLLREPGKIRECDNISPHLVEPTVPVRDPRTLTGDDKAKIEKAIRDENTKAGVSKLPQDANGDTFIDFDKDGNARIISGNYVEWVWDGTESKPQQNPDGTYKVTEEDKVIIFPAADILRNIKPDKPAIEEKEDNVVVTPQSADTDAATITLSYKNPDGNQKTLVATKDTSDGGTGKWTVPEGSDGIVNSDTGVVSLPSDKVENGGTVTATVTDRGGIADGDQDPKESERAPLPLKKKPEVSYDANGGTGKMKREALKTGATYTILENGFTAPEGQEFDHWQIGEDDKKPGETITIGEIDIVIKAIWKTKPTDPKKPDTPDDATTPTDTPDDATVPTPTPTPQEPTKPMGSSDQPQPTDTVHEPETTNPDVPEDPHSPGNWISPDPSDDWRNQLPLEGQKTPGSIQVIQQQSAPGAAPAPTASNTAPTSNEKDVKGLPRTGENPSLLVQSLAILLAAGGALALIQQRKIRIRR